jgi:malate dehydrogenase (oxaloacetate-decarboxylating)(NADP+)
MKLAAVYALAELAKEDVPESVSKAYNVKNLVFGKEYIIPKPLDQRLITTIAPAVAKAAMDSGVARKPINDLEQYKLELSRRLGIDNQLFHSITIKAKKSPKKVVFVEGNNLKVLKAAHEVLHDNIAKPILLGSIEEVRNMMAENHIDLCDTPIIDPHSIGTVEVRKAFADLIWNKRFRKGITLDEAYEMTYNRNCYGIMMVDTGLADAMISGVTSNYGEVMSPALKLIGPKPGLNRISSMYIIMTKKGPLFFADTTVNLNPDIQTIIETTLLTAEEVKKFNIEPVIALVSYSNFGSVKVSEHAKGPENVRQIVKHLHQHHPELIVDGEIQMDFALNKDLRHKKFPFTKLENRDVNTIIFPNLTSGNIAYKMMHEIGGAEIIGPILMGMKKPIHVVPMECSVREIVHMATIAVVDAQTYY